MARPRVPRVTVSLLGLALLAGAGLASAGSASGDTGARAGARAGAVAGSVVGHGYVALPPTRILDTRTSPTIHRLAQGATVNLRVTTLGGIPADGVSAVVLNVTGIARTRAAYLTVWPAGDRRPNASNLNLAVGQPRANQVIAQVGRSGYISIFNSAGSTDVLLDVQGYFVVGSSYTGQRPIRVMDTRKYMEGFGPLRNFPIAGKANIPATGATAVVVNATAVEEYQGGGSLTVFPGHEFTGANTTNLHVGKGEIGAALFVAPLNATGAIGMYGGGFNLILDVQGWFVGNADYTPITPTRILDSRATGALALRADTAIQVGGRSGLDVPATAGAAVLSLTAVKPSAGGYLTVHAGGTAVPGTSNLNVRAGATTSNMVIAQLDSTGRIALYDAAKDAGVLVDVMGWIDTEQA